MSYDDSDNRVFVPVGSKIGDVNPADNVVWEAACPKQCGSIMNTYQTRHNSKRYALRICVMNHLRRYHDMRGRTLSVWADKAVRHLPQD
jgi:hypothetical protein